MKLEKGQTSKKDIAVITEDMGERSVLFTISKEVVDRDGDILRASGVDFTNFMKNPVFLSFHNSREFPLGKVTKFWVEGNAVKAIVYFPTIEELSTNPEQASEKAKLVDFTYHCYKTGMLNAVSVGFIPKDWIEIRENGQWVGNDIKKWELLEFSAVAVPANQDAIAEAVKSFGNEFAKGILTVENKSGKKISAETRAVLDKIKACGDKLEECQKALKACGSELKSLLAELDDDKPDGEPAPKADDSKPCGGDDDEKSFTIVNDTEPTISII
ncbi:MAG: HK97 family phage prohead protease [Acutalibacteraceae bacterium]|nr:HK97 family phage prohead protease [Acutalibacteraceae bacterium]